MENSFLKKMIVIMNKVIVDDELNVKEQSFFNKAFSKNKSNFKLSSS